MHARPGLDQFLTGILNGNLTFVIYNLMANNIELFETSLHLGLPEGTVIRVSIEFDFGELISSLGETLSDMDLTGGSGGGVISPRAQTLRVMNPSTANPKYPYPSGRAMYDSYDSETGE